MADFLCPYAPPGRRRCPEAICDCFVDTYPDDPFGLHPEAFVVGTPDTAALLRGDRDVDDVELPDDEPSS